MSTNRAWPDVATPPGETLAEELAARGLTQTALARLMKRPVQVINEIINGSKAITPETAIQLEKVLGVPGDFWVRLEADYRYNKTRLEQARRASTRARSAATRRVSQRRVTTRNPAKD